VTFGADLNTLDGRVLKNVVIVRVEPNGITYRHSEGVSKIPFAQLPRETQAAYGYNANAAQSFSAQQQKTATEWQTNAQIHAKRITVKLSIIQLTSGGALVSGSTPYQVERSEVITQNMAIVGSANYVSHTKRWNETLYKPLPGIIFVRGLAGLDEGASWDGVIYPAGLFTYTTVRDVTQTIPQYSVNLADATYATLYPDAARRKAIKPNQPSGEAESIVSTGTGFFITEDGHLLTNHHVIKGSAQIRVRTKKGLMPAIVIRSDKAMDIALLKIVGKFPSLPLEQSGGVKLGSTVFTIGFPNPSIQGWSPKLTKGEISSLSGLRDDPNRFQISVAIQPGNSGGCLVNEYGNVVGVVVSSLNEIVALERTGSLPQSVNYAIKGDCVSSFLSGIPDLASQLTPAKPKDSRKFEDVTGLIFSIHS
jgi:V8-like Glu-specific endopeptidase